ncbi:argininosuccinate synthase [Acanthopleuribacter pedis]|uniref:Argininosuccinate synthase n=1 Tax=Acanthopleuribacter pedis TaxID=442870 RepID=A0A8J7Q971_9BACT|nr:argininosuccinate synthase [Acanthopleuribacter pedis]MBO1320037.1 argininosuccinate synthase [Acanthopleuribacter pedis]
MSKPQVKKAVLAYSGGLDTSVIIPWLRENYGCSVIAYTANVGQNPSEFDGLEQKALDSGAEKFVIEDLREEFIRDYLYPMIQSGARYETEYLLGTSIARPLIAKKMMDLVEAEGADAVAHGCTGKGNDQVRFEMAFKAFNPRIHIIAPWREWELRSREDCIEYAEKRNIKLQIKEKGIYSHDDNIWHLSSEGGELENPWENAPKGVFGRILPPWEAPDEGVEVIVGFKKGNPVSVDGEELGPVDLLEKLNKLGRDHGIGRIDIVENRLVGMKSRGVYETPGGTILYAAHREIESLVLDAETMHYKNQVAPKYAELIYNGRYFVPLREALDAFFRNTQENVTGEARLLLYKGNVLVQGRRSPYSLYREDFATFGQDDVYDQSDAEGFINLYGLSVKVRSLMEIEGSESLEGYRAPDYSKFKRD